MSMKNIRCTTEGILFVEITSPTKEEKEKYYTTGEMNLGNRSDKSPNEFQNAKIIKTFDKDRFPEGSTWMIGETKGMNINYFGQKITMIQERDIYAEVDIKKIEN